MCQGKENMNVMCHLSSQYMEGGVNELGADGVVRIGEGLSPVPACPTSVPITAMLTFPPV